MSPRSQVRKRHQKYRRSLIYSTGIANEPSERGSKKRDQNHRRQTFSNFGVEIAELELGATTRNKASNIHDESQFLFRSKLWSRPPQGNLEKDAGKQYRDHSARSTSSINLGSRTTPYKTCYFVRGCVQCKL